MNGTHYNVKLFNEVGLSSWNGATAIVGVAGGAVVSVDIQSPGSGYQDGDELFFDTSVIGGSANAKIAVATRGLSASGLSTNNGSAVQVTGIGTTAFGLYRSIAVPGRNTISIAKTAGDPESIPGQYIHVVAPVGNVSSNSYDSTTGTQTFNCSNPHGLVAGNRFRVTDSSNNNLGDYLVKSRVGVNTFTAVTNASLSAEYILKHGMSSNDGVSDPTEENIDARGVSLFDSECLRLGGFNGDTKLQVTSPHSGIATTKRFPLGSYLQIDEEIMRVVSSTITGVGNNEITVARGALGTGINTHDAGSLLHKVNPIAIEFRRPSIIRASGHTFEYLGYGPGNYSTGLPQVQDRTLSETEEFLSQAQERRGGVVVYTGMNNKGDFYVGNRRTSSATGEERTYDIPVSTVTGEDPSRLSVVFDEVTVKERLVVEGGDSGQILSQFDGPVTLNKEITTKDLVTSKGAVKISNDTQSTTKTTGALVVTGGAGIGKNLNVGGDLNVDGNTNFDYNITGAGATFGNIQIAITDDNTLDTSTGDLKIDAATNRIAVNADLSVDGELNVTGISTFRANVNLLDDDRLRLGTNHDLQLYHNGSNSLIEANGVGDLYIDSQNSNDLYLRSADDVFIQPQGGEDGIKVIGDGAVELYHNNAKKLETISDGVKITGELQVTDDITAFFSSDERLKLNITPIKEPLAKVLSISGNTFTWIEGGVHEGEDTGVIAQEIDALGLPGLTVTRETGYMAVKYDKLTALLIEAVKELSAKVDILEQKLSDK